MNEEKAKELFRRWYIEPIEKLKELPDGAGGWVAFMVALALYETLFRARFELRGESAEKDPVTGEDPIQREMAIDLHLTVHRQSIFWGMFRNGLFHGAMPKTGKTGYWLDGSFSEYPEFKEIDGVSIICINPWKFADRVLQRFLGRLSY